MYCYCSVGFSVLFVVRFATGNTTTENMRHYHSAGRYYYVRTSCDTSSDNAEHYKVIDINDISSHIQSFKEHIPRCCCSYLIDTRALNADASVITALFYSQCRLNLNSIHDIHVAAGIFGVDTLRKQAFCFSGAKSRLHIIEAEKLGINQMTVSCPAEVSRISSVNKTIELVLLTSPPPSASNGISNKESNRCSGAQRNKWSSIMEAATSKGMKIVGISLGISANSQHAFDKKNFLSNVRDAYDLASKYGHSVSFVDLGSILSDVCQCTLPAHKRCSTILEDLSNEDEHQPVSEPDQKSEEARAFSALVEIYLPRSLGIPVYVQHAHYFVPDDKLYKKWWGMPKAGRPVPSLHSYIAEGCSSCSTPFNRACLAYRRKKPNTCIESPPAA